LVHRRRAFDVRTAIALSGVKWGAVTVWFIGNYWGKSLLHFSDLRREAREMIYLYANVRVDHPANMARAQEGRARLREVAARIDALRVASPTPVLWYLRARGYELHPAAHGLTGLSNSWGGNEGAVERFRVQTLRALRPFY
jgi:hypothetical protein